MLSLPQQVDIYYLCLMYFEINKLISDKRLKVWKMPVMQYIGTWELKGFIDGIIPIDNMLVIKEREVDKLF